MAVLRSPDSRLRLDVDLRGAGHGRAACGMPAIRLTFDRRVIFNWSPITVGIGGKEVPKGNWRLRQTAEPIESSAALAGEETDDGIVRKLGLEFVAADSTADIMSVSFRCADGGLACSITPAASTEFRMPRGTQGIVADPAAPEGFVVLTAREALVRERGGATLLFPHGKCAALALRDNGWLLVIGDRPADLPANRVRGLLAAGGGSAVRRAHGIPPRAAMAPTAAATPAAFNCTVPFVVTPTQLAPQPLSWAPPGLRSVTKPHARALARIRALKWDDADVHWLRGELGEYLLVARRTSGGGWAISALTARARDWTVWLPFLAPGVAYRAVWHHDPPPAKPCYQPLPRRFGVDSRPLIHMAEAGGFTLDLAPVEPRVLALSRS